MIFFQGVHSKEVRFYLKEQNFISVQKRLRNCNNYGRQYCWLHRQPLYQMIQIFINHYNVSTFELYIYLFQNHIIFNKNILSKKTGGQIEIVIVDASCPAALVSKIKQLKIPIVASEYIVQCLINGRKLPYDASPLFSYLHKWHTHHQLHTKYARRFHSNNTPRFEAK